MRLSGSRALGVMAGVLGLAAAPAAAHVLFYTLAYRTIHAQSEATRVDAMSHRFEATILGTPSEVVGATVTAPGSAVSHELLETTPGYFVYGEGLATRGDLLSVYPAGRYTFDLPNIVHAERVGFATIPTPIAWPSEVPAFDAGTWQGMQARDPRRAFTLFFNTFDSIAPFQETVLKVTRRSTGVEVLSVSIRPTAGEHTIPQGLLVADEVYDVRLEFVGQYEYLRAGFGGAIAYIWVTHATLATLRTIVPCVADLDDGSGSGMPDGGVTIDDLLYYLDAYSRGATEADLDDGTGTGTADGGVTIDDLLYFVARYEAGC